MATRANIIIRKGKNDTFQMYHHYDGYPEGTGVDLQRIINGVKTENFPTAKSLAEYINSQDSAFECEQAEINTHGDIEYLYIVDLEKGVVLCFDTVEREEYTTQFVYDHLVYVLSVIEKLEYDD